MNSWKIPIQSNPNKIYHFHPSDRRLVHPAHRLQRKTQPNRVQLESRIPRGEDEVGQRTRELFHRVAGVQQKFIQKYSAGETLGLFIGR